MVAANDELSIEKLDRQLYRIIIQLKASLQKVSFPLEFSSNDQLIITGEGHDSYSPQNLDLSEHALCKARINDFQELLKTEYRNRCK
jgi:hypothetical protein